MTSGKRTYYNASLPTPLLESLIWSHTRRLRALINEYWVVLHVRGMSFSEAETVINEICGLAGQLKALLREAQRRRLSVMSAEASVIESMA